MIARILRGRGFLREAPRVLWLARAKLPGFLNVPVPCRLPFGGWFLAYGDHMGLAVLGRTALRRAMRQALGEPDEGCCRFVSRFLKPNMTVVDIGANQGFYTILASRRVGPGGRVFAFEPAPGELRRLRTNLRLNRCRNVVIEPQAVGGYVGVTEFYLCRDPEGVCSSIRPQAEDVASRKKRTSVPITTLDAYAQVNRLRSLDFMKIDVEGGELEVLRGASGVLTALRPVVMCELSSVRTRQWGYRAIAIYQFLVSQRYSWYRPNADGILQAAATLCDGENLIAVPSQKPINFDVWG